MKIKTIHAPLSFVFFLASLALPAIVSEKGSTGLGIELLLLGWIGLLMAQMSWLANLFYLLALLLPGLRPRSSSTLAFIALGFSLLPLVDQRVDYSGSSGISYVEKFETGYALWVCAMAMLAAGEWRMSKGASAGSAAKAGLLSAVLILTAFGLYYLNGNFFWQQ